MDSTDIRLLHVLHKDSRITVSELSKQLSLSRPSVTERILRLQEKGIIEGFTLQLSLAGLGRGTLVFIQVSELKVTPMEFERVITTFREVLECHRVTGNIGYILKAALTGMDELRALVDRLIPYGTLQTSLVLTSPVLNRNPLPQGP
ncbi:AsnC family transcriptional regulator [Paenibacillus swuensis]|uniref:AsnC family transcriptional regulator n=1 Tax=Paenibacillus swuensis TaxID=1178515 RepID=A0A172TQ20_9BACL|nr:Lrp/AsnC family transcriptional regulator [Paenibacillus swuensis]ANE49066.1 AsnC family transcriptional regulator [Paenibacillus swuensis]